MRSFTFELKEFKSSGTQGRDEKDRNRQTDIHSDTQTDRQTNRTSGTRRSQIYILTFREINVMFWKDSH